MTWMARGNLSGWPFQKRPKPVHSSFLNVVANKNVLADANVSRLISLVQGYVSVQEDAAIISINLILIEYVPDSVLPVSFFQSFFDSW